jgi:hypothetical protein
MPVPAVPPSAPTLPLKPVASPSTAALATSPPSAASSSGRTARSARFISADAAAARFDLTADGKLPELQLADRQAAAAADAPPKRSQPWLLIGLLAFSVGSSVLMLLLDTSVSTESKASRAAAREVIERFYAGQSPRLEPYQTKLRLALQAETRGNRAEERRLYQEVLALLRSEGTSKFKGLTGMASSGVDPPDGPPNDRHLERLISTMLSDE